MEAFPGIQIKTKEDMFLHLGAQAFSEVSRVIESSRPAFIGASQIRDMALNAAHQTPLNTPLGRYVQPLKWLGAGAAVVATTKAIYDYWMQDTEKEKLNNELSEVKKENEKLRNQTDTLVDDLMSKFKKIIDQQNEEHKKQLQELVQHYENELKKKEEK